MKKTVSIRIDINLYGDIKKKAGLQNRNFSNFVETVLKEYIRAYEDEAVKE